MNAVTTWPAPTQKAKHAVRGEQLVAAVAADLINCGYWFSCQPTIYREAGIADEYEFAVDEKLRLDLRNIVANARHRAGQ